jgi:CbtA_toxin of type IV toxin-antitoxin system
VALSFASTTASKDKIMNLKLFKQLAESMLKTHFGIGLNDTILSEDQYVLECINSGDTVFDSINEEVSKFELERITGKTHSFGVSNDAELDINDQRIAMTQIGAFFSHLEETVTCPHCGCRTDFEELVLYEVSSGSLNKDSQHHKCLNDLCGFEFITEPDLDAIDEKEIEHV